jgi:hypothetical protein
MGEPSVVAQRAAFARRAARMLAAHVAEPLPAVQDAERQPAVARAAVRAIFSPHGNDQNRYGGL